jgi:hypothetical protein
MREEDCGRTYCVFFLLALIMFATELLHSLCGTISERPCKHSVVTGVPFRKPGDRLSINHALLTNNYTKVVHAQPGIKQLVLSVYIWYNIISLCRNFQLAIYCSLMPARATEISSELQKSLDS